MADRMTFDREVVAAAVAAAPIFRANRWQYHVTDGNGHIPDAFELMCTVQRLVDGVRSVDVELDEDGHGQAFTASGRWHVARFITGYNFDPSDDEISIALELAEIDEAEAQR